MSALDLFASAMGAFLLIAVIAFPHYKKEIPDLRSKISTLKAESMEKSKQIEQQAAKIKELEKKLEASQTQVAQLQQEISELKAESAEKSKQIVQQVEKIEKLEKKLEASQTQVAQLQQEISKIKAESAEKSKQIKQQVAQIEKLEKQLEASQAQVALLRSVEKNERIVQQVAQIEELEKQLEASQAQIVLLEQEDNKLEKNAKFQLPHVDIVIVLDTTGSMGSVIKSLKQELANMAAILGQLAPSAAIGIIGFNDIQQTPAEYTIFPLQKIAVGDGSVERLERKLESVKAGDASGDNPDRPENLHGGFKLATQAQWRASSKVQIIIVVTDALPHPGTEGDIFTAAGDFAADTKKSVTTVNVGSQNWLMRFFNIRRDNDNEEFMKELAVAGGGRYVETQSSLVAPILLGLLANS